MAEEPRFDRRTMAEAVQKAVALLRARPEGVELPATILRDYVRDGVDPWPLVLALAQIGSDVLETLTEIDPERGGVAYLEALGQAAAVRLAGLDQSGDELA